MRWGEGTINFGAQVFQTFFSDVLVKHYQVCIELWPSTFSENVYFVIANLILCYLAPLSVITFCYVIIWKSVANRSIPGEYLGYKSTRDTINKSRLKVTKMVFVVIITFALSWLPLYCIFCIVKFRDDILYDEQGQGEILFFRSNNINSCTNDSNY